MVMIGIFVGCTSWHG